MQNLIFPDEEISRLTLPQRTQELYSTSLYACQRLRSERVLTVEDDETASSAERVVEKLERTNGGI